MRLTFSLLSTFVTLTLGHNTTEDGCFNSWKNANINCALPFERRSQMAEADCLQACKDYLPRCTSVVYNTAAMRCDLYEVPIVVQLPTVQQGSYGSGNPPLKPNGAGYGGQPSPYGIPQQPTQNGYGQQQQTNGYRPQQPNGGGYPQPTNGGGNGAHTHGGQHTHGQQTGQQTNGGSYGQQTGQQTNGGSYGQQTGQQTNGGSYGQQTGQQTNGGSYGQQTGQQTNGGSYGQQAGQQTNGGSYGQQTGQQTNGGTYGQQNGQQTNGGSYGQQTGQQTNGGSYGQQTGQQTNGGGYGPPVNGQQTNGGNYGQQTSQPGGGYGPVGGQQPTNGGGQQYGQQTSGATYGQQTGQQTNGAQVYGPPIGGQNGGPVNGQQPAAPSPYGQTNGQAGADGAHVHDNTNGAHTHGASGAHTHGPTPGQQPATGQQRGYSYSQNQVPPNGLYPANGRLSVGPTPEDYHNDIHKRKKRHPVPSGYGGSNGGFSTNGNGNGYSGNGGTPGIIIGADASNCQSNKPVVEFSNGYDLYKLTDICAGTSNGGGNGYGGNGGAPTVGPTDGPNGDTTTAPTGESSCPDGQVARFAEAVGWEMSNFNDVEFAAASAEECMDACASNQQLDGSAAPCQLAEFNEGSGTCTFTEELPAPAGGGELVPNDDVILLQKHCYDEALAEKCPGPFRLDPQYLLLGFSETVTDATDLQNCIAQCMDSEALFGFGCRSGMMFYEQTEFNCVLNVETADTQPDLFTETDEDQADYFEPGCSFRRRFFSRDFGGHQDVLSQGDWGPWTVCNLELRKQARYKNCKTANPFTCTRQTRKCVRGRDGFKPNAQFVQAHALAARTGTATCNMWRTCCALSNPDGSLDCERGRRITNSGLVQCPPTNCKG